MMMCSCLPRIFALKMLCVTSLLVAYGTIVFGGNDDTANIKNIIDNTSNHHISFIGYGENFGKSTTIYSKANPDGTVWTRLEMAGGGSPYVALTNDSGTYTIIGKTAIKQM